MLVKRFDGDAENIMPSALNVAANGAPAVQGLFSTKVAGMVYFFHFGIV